MKTTMPRLLIVWAVIAVCGSCSRAEDKYLTDKNGGVELKYAIDLKDEQGGVAGSSVAEWNIKPGGQWRYLEYSVRDRQTVEMLEEKSGALSQKQLILLGKALDENDPLGLPAKLGDGSKTNPHELTFSFGDARAKVVGLPTRRGQSLKEIILNAPPSGRTDSVSRSRFAAVAGAVEEAAKGD